MSHQVRMWVVFGLLAVVLGCAKNHPHRTFTVRSNASQATPAAECLQLAESPLVCTATENPWGRRPGLGATCTSIDRLEASTPRDRGAARDAACFTTEAHPASQDAGLPHEGFDLHVVEFDDQGRPWDDQATGRTLDRLRQRVLDDPVLVVTFVHGWKHNGRVCDGNMSCFRDVLEILAKAERRFAFKVNDYYDALVQSGLLPGGWPPRRPRRVVGVAIGWRGQTWKWEPLANVLSFWGRKHTAHVVGDNGSATSLIEGIREIAAQKPGSTAVFVGHSFGGALLLSAMSTSMNGSVRQAREAAGNPWVDMRGDLFFLVNPAVEGARYNNLFADISASPAFQARQMPVMLTLASEGDTAVKVAFPAGQVVSTWLRSARDRLQWQSLLQGAGHFKPFYTHILLSKEETAPEPEPRSTSPCACPSGLRKYGDALIERLDKFYGNTIIEEFRGLVTRVFQNRLPSEVSAAVDAVSDAFVSRFIGSELDVPTGLASFREFKYSTLEPVRPLDPHRPFLTVNVDDRIVGSHGDIFNPRFLDFLIEYTVLVERKRQTLTAAFLAERRQ